MPTNANQLIDAFLLSYDAGVTTSMAMVATAWGFYPDDEGPKIVNLYHDDKSFWQIKTSSECITVTLETRSPKGKGMKKETPSAIVEINILVAKFAKAITCQTKELQGLLETKANFAEAGAAWFGAGRETEEHKEKIKALEAGAKQMQDGIKELEDALEKAEGIRRHLDSLNDEEMARFEKILDDQSRDES
jgi:hypothetical protein